MPLRTASAQWNGPLVEGNGTMAFGSGAYEGQYSYGSRFEEGTGTNPEELIAAAHAGCFSMAFAGNLTRAGHNPEQVNSEAQVQLDKQADGFAITHIHLVTRARVPGIDDETFQRVAEETKVGCPVSQALKAVDLSVEATLES
jgi:osmotically inducible protein OsmC